MEDLFENVFIIYTNASSNFYSSATQAAQHWDMYMGIEISKLHTLTSSMIEVVGMIYIRGSFCMV